MPLTLDPVIECEPDLPGDWDIPPTDFDDGDDDDRDRCRWLTVATFWEPIEAHIARLKLESEEIDCMIIDENLIATYWCWASALGGVKLQVRESDLSQAHDLLHRDQQIEKASKAICEGHCPRCGFEPIIPKTFSGRIAYAAILLLAAPLQLIHRRQVCPSCGCRWKQ